MSQITVVGTYHLAEGQEEAGITAFQDLVGKSLQEDGCLSYSLHRELEDPRNLVGIEHWVTKDHLDAHMQQPYVAELIGQADTLLDRPFDLKIFGPVISA